MEDRGQRTSSISTRPLKVLRVSRRRSRDSHGRVSHGQFIFPWRKVYRPIWTPDLGPQRGNTAETDEYILRQTVTAKGLLDFTTRLARRLSDQPFWSCVSVIINPPSRRMLELALDRKSLTATHDDPAGSRYCSTYYARDGIQFSSGRSVRRRSKHERPISRS